MERILSSKGWFTPPFETFDSLKERLEKGCRLDEYYKEGSIRVFQGNERIALGYEDIPEDTDPVHRCGRHWRCRDDVDGPNRSQLERRPYAGCPPGQDALAGNVFP